MSPSTSAKLTLIVAALAAVATFYLGIFLIPLPDTMNDRIELAIGMAVFSAIVFFAILVLGFFYPPIRKRSTKKKRSTELDWRQIKPNGPGSAD